MQAGVSVCARACARMCVRALLPLQQQDKAVTRTRDKAHVLHRT